MKYILAALFLFLAGCDRVSGVNFNPEIAIATAAAVDAQEDITDRPSIPDSLQGYKSGPVPHPTPAAKDTKPPAGASQVTLFIGDTVTQSCNRRSCTLVKTVSGVHDDYWKARGYKGGGFRIDTKPVTDEDLKRFSGNVPCYLWKRDGIEMWVYGIPPDQFQSSFDQTPKAGK